MARSRAQLLLDRQVHCQARESMTSLMDYIRVTTNRVNVEVDDLDSLRYVMNVLKEVRVPPDGMSGSYPDQCGRIATCYLLDRIAPFHDNGDRYGWQYASGIPPTGVLKGITEYARKIETIQT